MANDATIVENPDSSTTEPTERKMIPIPADKVRNWTREISDLKSQLRQATLSERPSGPGTINKEQQDALDLIGDTVTQKVSTEFSSFQDQLDEMSLERGLDRVYSDPNSSLYAEEMQDELRKLMQSNPKARVNDLISKAEDQAIARAYKAGKLTESIREEEAETQRIKSTLSTPHQASSRGEAPQPLEKMTAEELAASGRFDEYFQMRTGQTPKRR